MHVPNYYAQQSFQPFHFYKKKKVICEIISISRLLQTEIKQFSSQNFILGDVTFAHRTPCSKGASELFRPLNLSGFGWYLLLLFCMRTEYPPRAVA